MKNHRLVTKAQPFKLTLYKWYCLGLFMYESNIILGSLRIASLQYFFLKFKIPYSYFLIWVIHLIVIELDFY